jgi:hypothetical protein
LYQAQRTLLQRRATEKDHQVELIAKEKEELREKLNQLSSLVPQLVSNNTGILFCSLYCHNYGFTFEYS